MSVLQWFLIIVGSLFALAVIRGDMIMRRRRKLQNLVLDSVTNGELLGQVIYQGGYPPMPKPALLALGICDEGLLLVNHKGEKGVVDFSTFKKMEKFTLKREKQRGPKGAAVVQYGGVSLPAVKTTYLYMFNINYTDIDGDENNIVFQVKKKEDRDRYYDILYERFKKI